MEAFLVLLVIGAAALAGAREVTRLVDLLVEAHDDVDRRADLLRGADLGADRRDPDHHARAA